MVAGVLSVRSPDEVELLVCLVFAAKMHFEVLIDSGKVLGFETKLREKSRVGGRVAGILDVPADFWGHSEFLLHERMADHDVVNQIFIVWTGLISRTPSSCSDLKLAVLNQPLEFVLSSLILTRVPHLEELNLGESESTLRVFGELLGYGSKNSANSGVVDHLLGARIILVDRF